MSEAIEGTWRLADGRYIAVHEMRIVGIGDLFAADAAYRDALRVDPVLAGGPGDDGGGMG